MNHPFAISDMVDPGGSGQVVIRRGVWVSGLDFALRHHDFLSQLRTSFQCYDCA